jgi:hypothetical protein
MMAFSFWSLLFSTSALWLWEIVEIVGAVIVTIGVIGEYVASFTTIPKGRIGKKKWEKRSTLILIFGLAVELVGLVSTICLSNIEIAQLHKETAELELKLQPRTITAQQCKSFISFLQDAPKSPISLYAIAKNGDDLAP